MQVLNQFVQPAIVDFLDTLENDSQNLNKYLVNQSFEFENEVKMRDMMRMNFMIQDIIQFLIIHFKEIKASEEQVKSTFVELFKVANKLNFSEGIRKVSIKVDSNQQSLTMVASIFDILNDRNPWSSATIYEVNPFNLSEYKQSLINSLLAFIFRKQRLMWIVEINKEEITEKEDFTETFLVKPLTEMIDTENFFIEISPRNIHIRYGQNDQRWNYGIKRLNYK